MQDAPEPQAPQRRTIACTPENVGEFRAAVKRWPQLHALVGSLQAKGLFPGLRAVEITLEGDAEYVAKGLAAIGAQSPVAGAQNGQGEGQ